MRVMVTGAAGFIGHKLVERFLKQTDWELVLIDRLDSSGNLNRLKEVLDQFSSSDRSRVMFQYHDLKAEFSNQLVEQIGPINQIYHLAAQSHVDRSITNPVEFMNDNTVATVNLLEYARRLKDLSLFLFFSTDEVFGPAPGQVMYGEYSRQNPTNPYSASKAAAEQFCFAYHNTYNLPIVVTRTMNCFGVRQHPEKYIPKVIRKVYNGETVYVHSSPDKKTPGSRFYISTDSVSEAVLHIQSLGTSLLVPNDDCIKLPIYNLVGKEETNNLELAKMIAESVGKPLNYELVDFHSSRPGHDLRYALSGQLLKSLGWEPKDPISLKIDQTVQWYLQNPKWLLGAVD